MSKKFSPMRFTAATEEAAVEGALQLVGAARDEISYDFISQTAKGVTIRIRPYEAEAPVARAEPETAPPEMTEMEEEIEADAPLHLDSMDDFADDEDAEDADSNDENADDLNSEDADDEAVDDENADETSDDELDFDADLELADDEYDSDEDEDADDDEDDEDDEDELDENYDSGEEEEEPEIEVDAEMLERALTLARAMLDKMGLEARVERGRATDADIVPLKIEGEDVGILIGKYGATLQSFQYLMNLTLSQGGESASRVAVDAGNYRARREESLQAVARGAAHRARRDGRPVKMDPMPANERRIVHDFLKSEAGISTQSEGREPHRCVVIAPGASDYNGASDDYRGRRGMGNYGRGRNGRNRR